MGSPRYCKNEYCNAGLPYPSASDDLILGGQTCYACKTKQDKMQTVEEWIVELDERLTRIEEGRTG